MLLHGMCKGPRNVARLEKIGQARAQTLAQALVYHTPRRRIGVKGEAAKPGQRPPLHRSDGVALGSLQFGDCQQPPHGGPGRGKTGRAKARPTADGGDAGGAGTRGERGTQKQGQNNPTGGNPRPPHGAHGEEQPPRRGPPTRPATGRKDRAERRGGRRRPGATATGRAPQGASRGPRREQPRSRRGIQKRGGTAAPKGRRDDATKAVGRATRPAPRSGAGHPRVGPETAARARAARPPAHGPAERQGRAGKKARTRRARGRPDQGRGPGGPYRGGHCMAVSKTLPSAPGRTRSTGSTAQT